MYRFVRCQTHPKCPDVIGWYLVLKPDDVDTLMKLHKGIANLYFFKFGMDLHITESEMAPHYNPIKLAAQWLQSIKRLLQEGSVAVNSNGGCVPLNSVKVLSESTNQRLDWPDYYDDEVITISRWTGGRHYYLSSNRNRIFVPAKYCDLKAARYTAQKYTNHIQTRENASPLPTFQ